MIKKEFIVKNKLGLHARPAALFVQTASRYQSEVKVSKGETEVNGKSVMGLMMLAAECGSTIVLTVEGTDEEEAAANLIAFLESEESGGVGC